MLLQIFKNIFHICLDRNFQRMSGKKTEFALLLTSYKNFKDSNLIVETEFDFDHP